MITYSKQSISDADIKEVSKVLKSKFLTQGPVILKFEKNISKFVNSQYTLATNSASSALLLACQATGLKDGDIAWTTTNTYVATANAILHCRAKVKFVDINLENYNICVDNLHKKLIEAKKKKLLPKLIIVVHFAGLPCPMKEIKQLSIIYKFKIIEDASHALGAKYYKSKIGDCSYSDICIFSFHPVKIITTGEGGAICTNNKKYFNIIKMLRSGGISREKKIMLKKNNNELYYEQHYLGYNFRLSDICAALGNSQLKKIKNFQKKRKKIVAIYNKELTNLPLKLPPIYKNYESANHLYVIILENFNKDIFYSKLKKKGIQCNYHYIPLYKHPFYKTYNIRKNEFKNSELYYKNAISLPLFPEMKKKSLLYIIKNIKNILNT
jgi:UDP-4-amino-4,6-dideoxy-N-acetyl-beta-L-altrosamine transaminase